MTRCSGRPWGDVGQVGAQTVRRRRPGWPPPILARAEGGGGRELTWTGLTGGLIGAFDDVGRGGRARAGPPPHFLWRGAGGERSHLPSLLARPRAGQGALGGPLIDAHLLGGPPRSPPHQPYRPSQRRRAPPARRGRLHPPHIPRRCWQRRRRGQQVLAFPRAPPLPTPPPVAHKEVERVGRTPLGAGAGGRGGGGASVATPCGATAGAGSPVVVGGGEGAG